MIFFFSRSQERKLNSYKSFTTSIAKIYLKVATSEANFSKKIRLKHGILSDFYVVLARF